MNLLFINYEYPPLGGGGANATRELALALVKMGHEVTVLTSRTPKLKGCTNDGGVQVYRLRGLRASEHRSNLIEMFVFLCSAYFTASRIAKNHQSQAVVCFFSLPSGPIGLLLLRKIGLPYLVSLRGGDVPGLAPELTSIHNILKPVRRKILANARAIIANSNFLAEKAILADGFPVKVVPNGVDVIYFSPRKNNMDGSLRQSICKLLFVGRLHRQKNMTGLLDGLAIAKNDYHLDFHLSVVGDGPERDTAVSVANEHDLSNRIDWYGWLEKESIKDLYQQSDCVLSMSTYEGLPNVVLEAMSSGLLVIVSDIPPHRELVQDEVTGYLVSLSDSNGIAEKMMAIANDIEKSSHVRSMARQNMVENYSWETSAREYIRLLTAVNSEDRQ